MIAREVCSSFDVLLAANGCLMAHVPGRPVSALLVMARLERVEWARWVLGCWGGEWIVSVERTVRVGLRLGLGVRVRVL